MAETIIKGFVTVTVTPSRKTIKAQKQVSQGKERALKSKLKGMILQAKSQIKGLENAGINSPALQKLKQKTDLKTKGKNYQQLQSTYFAVDSFLKSQTASVKGAMQNLNSISSMIGAKNMSASQVASMANEFFQIASYAKQALQVSGQSVGSPRIFEAIRKVTKQYEQKWNSSTDIMQKTSAVLEALQKQQAETMQNEMAEYVINVFAGVK